MLIKILIAVAVVVVAFVVIVALRPSDFRVARSTTAAAPAPAVFAHVNDFHKWPAWSPYEKLDPAMTKTFDGAPTGTGARYAWAGNSKAGEGRITITESRPSDLIRMKLEFVKPFVATNDVAFTFTPDGDRTAVTWSMTGRNNFMFKAVGLFMSMDKMVGGEFEKGLADLKAVVEAAPNS
jgi:hypothetical protein